MKFLIVLMFLTGLAAVAGSIVVGQKVFDGKVVDKPYETGLLWDKIQKDKSELDVRIKDGKFRTGENEIFFSLSDKEGNPLSGADVKVTISRPSTSIYDRNYEAVKSGSKGYRATVHLPLPGDWDIKIRIIHRGRDLTFEKRIYGEE